MADVLIVMSGLPGTGKSTVSRELARQLGGCLVRIDTIEQAIGRARDDEQPVGAAGYVVAYAVAEDQLRLGLTVVADSVNPVAATREAWRDVARRTGSCVVDVEVVCSDAREHRNRVDTRSSDIADLRLPTWDEVLRGNYERWDREHVVVDTASRDVAQCVAQLRAAAGI